VYEVGDILWIVSHEKPGVRPFTVVEEVIKKTTSGTTTEFFVESIANSRRVKLGSINGEIYKNVEEAKKGLMAKAEVAIDKMLNVGIEMIESKNKSDVTQDLNKAEDLPEIPLEGTDSTILLPDGTRAKVNIIGDIQ
tara:strand:- start:1816 stop:2226 length:411 start_codon:yes stop_codon:yes gene_type:complete